MTTSSAYFSSLVSRIRLVQPDSLSLILQLAVVELWRKLYPLESSANITSASSVFILEWWKLFSHKKQIVIYF